MTAEEPRVRKNLVVEREEIPQYRCDICGMGRLRRKEVTEYVAEPEIVIDDRSKRRAERDRRHSSPPRYTTSQAIESAPARVEIEADQHIHVCQYCLGEN